MDRIGYLSECDKEYTKSLTAAETLDDLREHAKRWEPVAADALEIVSGMTEDGFKAFRKGLRSERRGKFAGEEWMNKYGAVMLPAVLFEASIVASLYMVPWGLAYIRLRESGRIVESARGVATVTKLSA